MDKNLNKEPSINDENSRIARLIKMVQEIRNEPRQSLDNLLNYFAISRSQFYKDRDALAQIGFKFSYNKSKGFEITEDKLAPVTGFSLSDRLILMFALEHLSTSGEAHLAAKAMQVARKLAGGLDEPFKTHLLQCFDRQITKQAFGVQPEIMDALQEAINLGRRIRIHYQRGIDWSTRWREVEPRRIYLRQRTLYLYARTVDENPVQWKVFRLNRIQALQPTGMYFTIQPAADDGFQVRMKNAFEAVIGGQTHQVSVKFHSHASGYIKEKQWHHSQQITPLPNGDIIFTVSVADPQEVIRWARQFDQHAAIVNSPDSQPV